MAVSKTEDGVYRVDMRSQGRHGKRMRRTFRTRAEATQFERYTPATNHNKEWSEKPADRRPLTDLIELWWKYHGSSLKSGQSMYKKLHNLNAMLNYPKAHQINKKRFFDYQAMRIEDGRKPETINKAQWLLSCVFAVLIKKGHYHSENPVKVLKR